jgi:molybdopterin synthase catalytic subunit
MNGKAMKVKILFFASIKERAGISQIEVDLNAGTSVQELKTFLGENYPGLKKVMGNTLTSVNRSFALNEDIIPDGAEVAFFPPVSGGNEIIRVIELTRADIGIDELVHQITIPATGAVCSFIGVIRGFTERDHPHITKALDYEAYEPMALEKLNQIADEMQSRWPDLQGIAMVQRIGLQVPMNPTVLVACSASHRDTGVFEAAKYGIDRLKEIVPIWKKEIGPDGEEWVEGDYLPKRGE